MNDIVVILVFVCIVGIATWHARVLRTMPTQHAPVTILKSTSVNTRVSGSEAAQRASIVQAGVPERRILGKVRKGIEPDARKAVRYHRMALRRGCTDGLEEYADLLAHGTPTDESVVDLRGAIDAYRALATIDTISDTKKYQVLDKAHACAERIPDPTLAATLACARRRVAYRRPSRPVVVRHIEHTPPQLPRRDEAAAMAVTMGTIRNDAQNAHDSGVTKTMRASVHRLRALDTSTAEYDAVGVRRFIENFSEIDSSVRDNAIIALDAIERTNHTVGSLGMSEVEVLGLVWRRISHPDNVSNRHALHSNLVDELASATEHGKPVCTTGRVSRILNSLNGVDTVVDIKPTWAISRELVNKAGAIRARRFAEHADKEALETTNPTPDQQHIADMFSANVQKEIKDTFAKEYVEPGILTHEALHAELAPWIDSIS